MQIKGEKMEKKNLTIITQKLTCHFANIGIWYDKHPKVTKDIHHKIKILA